MIEQELDNLPFPTLIRVKIIYASRNKIGIDVKYPYGYIY